jgi:ABC-type branched-subunit amino acid transport system ATPase component
VSTEDIRRDALLEVRDVAVRFGGVNAVRGVSLKLHKSEILGLIGPNGAGKSSLLGALGGQLRTRAGVITLDGKDITSAAPYRRARLGLGRTFQDTSTFDGLTIYENLLVSALRAEGTGLTAALGSGRARRKRQVDAIDATWERLHEFEMIEVANRYGSELSGGQRRLVEIMRCLMQKPKVLLLDEPMVGVAPHLVLRIREECERIRDSGVSIIIVEHSLEVVEAICDRVVVMAAGEVIADASYEEAMRSGAVKEAYFA